MLLKHKRTHPLLHHPFAPSISSNRNSFANTSLPSPALLTPPPHLLQQLVFCKAHPALQQRSIHLVSLQLSSQRNSSIQQTRSTRTARPLHAFTAWRAAASCAASAAGSCSSSWAAAFAAVAPAAAICASCCCCRPLLLQLSRELALAWWVAADG
jgi:hypothetical protein